jgi:O-antigen ligase
MFLLVIIIFLICIVSIKNPLYGLLAFIANLLIGIAIRYPKFTTIPIMNLLALSILVGCWFVIRSGETTWASFPEKEDKFFLCFLGVICIGLAIKSNLNEFFNEIKISLPILVLMFYGGSRLVNSTRSLRAVVSIIVIIIVFLAIEGIFFSRSFVDIQSIYSGAELHELLKSSSANERFVGLGRFDNSNEVALIMNIAMPFLLLHMVDYRSIFYFLCSVFAFICTSSLTIMTLSRAGFLGFVSMLFVFTLSGKKKIRKALVCAALLGALTPLVSSSFIARINTISYRNPDRSSEGRITAWREGYSAIKWHPILGLGKGNFLKYHNLMPHNSLIQVTAETGLIGGSLWVILIILAFKKLVKIDNMVLNESEDAKYIKRVATGLKLALVGFFVTSFFGNQGFNPLLYLFLGLPHAMDRLAVDFSLKPVNNNSQHE